MTMLQHAAQHVGRLSGLHIQLEHGIETGEVDEHGLAIAPVVAVSGC
jgi:hypothetical protein